MDNKIIITLDKNQIVLRLKGFFLTFILAILLIKSNSLYATEEASPIIQSPKQNTPEWHFLSNYLATYQVFYDDDLVGSAEESLTFQAGHWTLRMSAELKKLFFKVKSNEFSKFNIDGEQLLAERFYSKTEMTFKKDKVIEQVFDWKNKVETGTYKSKSWQLPLSEQVFDRMSHTIQLRKDLITNNKSGEKNEHILTYLVSHKGKNHQYQYQLIKGEKVVTTFGEFDAIKLQRKKLNGDKFLIWLSPDLDFFPIKIAQKEKDKAEVFFLLKSLEYK